MRVLALDTVSPAPSIALVTLSGTTLLSSDVEALPPAAAERLAATVRALLARAAVPPSGLDRVAVLSGPGSFTGLRAGAAFARGLARALGVPLVAVPTFAAASRAAGGDDAVRLLLDAGRGDVLSARRAPGAPPPREGVLLRREAALAEAASEGERVVDLDREALPLAEPAALASAGDPARLPTLSAALAYGRPSAAEERFGPPCPSPPSPTR